MNAAHPPSFKSCWQRAIGDSDLPSTTKHVLQTISIHFMDENGGRCYPTVEQLMQKTSLSNRCVIDHLNLAVDKGWLKHTPYGKGQAWRRWNYQAVFPDNVVNEVHHLPDNVVNEVHHLPDNVVNEVHHLPDNVVNEVHHLPDNVVNEVHHLPDNVVNEVHDLPDNVVNEVHDLPDNVVNEVHHKPCRDITMERESNHARAHPREAATPASASATAPALSVSEQEKTPRMTKLTDAVIEAAQKTIRQRNVREDLSDAALRHSIEKCRAQKGYCEMTEAAWIETLVQWVGKERLPNGAASRWEKSSSCPPAIPSPEEKVRQNADYEARMAIAEAQHRQRLESYHAAHCPLSIADPTPPAVERPVDPVQTLHALAAKVRMGATATPAPPAQRTFGPMGALPARRPPLTAERRDALNAVLREMQKSGCAAEDLTRVYQGVQDAPEDAWPAIIAQARQCLTPPAQAVA